MRSPLILLAAMLVFAGCRGNADEATNAGDSDAGPYAAYAGDWMSESYAADAEEGDEPLVVTLIKANETADGWTVKFTHLDEPVPMTVSMRGDSIAMMFGSYPSALREDVMVDNVTAVMHMDGDMMMGRFYARYADEAGTMLNGTMKSERIE